MHDPVVVQQGEVDRVVRQGDTGERLSDMPHFCLWRFQEFSSDWCIEEEMPDFNARANGASTGDDGPRFTPMDFNLASRMLTCDSTSQDEVTDFRNRRQGLSAKSK